MNPATELVIKSDSLSILELVSQATLLVQLVMLLLAIASLVSWTLIFTKAATLKSLRGEADRFDASFWSGGDLANLYRDLSSDSAESAGMASIFVAGYGEYNRLAGNSTIDRADLVDGVHRAMRVALSREIEILESNLSFLATVGSTSPYVGLFGTVWGIMNSFQSIAISRNTSLAIVAPGIAEALFATALGLLAAIPAVVAFNKFRNDSRKYLQKLENFSKRLLSII